MQLPYANPGHANGFSRPLAIGETQILNAADLAVYEADAQRRGHHVDARPASYGAGKLFVVRTFETVDDLDEARSLLYLGLPLITDRPRFDLAVRPGRHGLSDQPRPAASRHHQE